MTKAEKSIGILNHLEVWKQSKIGAHLTLSKERCVCVGGGGVCLSVWCMSCCVHLCVGGSVIDTYYIKGNLTKLVKQMMI